MSSNPSLPPSYSTDELPDYRTSLSLERSPAYTELSLTSTRTSSTSVSSDGGPKLIPSGRLSYASKRLTLDLGPRIWAPLLPVYGRNGLIEGHVEIKNFKHVNRVELTLSGVVLSYMVSNGNPTLRSKKVVLCESSTIWSAKSDACPSDGRSNETFPFIFALPDHVQGSEAHVSTPLPPSTSVQTNESSAHVFYFLRLDMYRNGIHFHDSVQTEILYLPRTVSHYERPYIPLPGSEKPRRICDGEWRTAEIPRKSISGSPKSLPGLGNVDVHLSLPHKLHYPSGCAIPFAVTLSGQGLSCANIPELTAGLKLKLIKTSTTLVKGIISKQETVVSIGKICRIDEDERHWRSSKPGDNSRQVVIRGCLETGTKGKDQSWGVRGHAGVSYQVRVTLAPSAEGSHRDGDAVWERSETVVITSHEFEGRAAMGTPALSLPASSRNPMSIATAGGPRFLSKVPTHKGPSNISTTSTLHYVLLSPSPNMKSGATLSLLTAVSTVSGLHFPVSRVKPRTLSSGLERRGFTVLAASSDPTLTNTENNIYTTTMQIKGKDVVMQVDTGSSDTWLYPTSSTRDLYTDAVPYSDLPLTLSYGRGQVAGHIAQMTVGFAGYTVQNQGILLVEQQREMSLIEANLTNGLLGLGFDTLSAISNTVVQKTQQTWGRTLLSNIFISDPTTPNHIAFRLDRHDDGNTTDVGAFDIGTFAPGFESVNSTAEIPIFSSNAQANVYWNVLVDSVTLNGKAQTLSSTVNGGTQTPPAGKVSAVLDTGYSLPQLSPDLAHAIYSAMGGVLIDDSNNTAYAVPCMAEAQLVFSIGGHTIPIHPLDLTQVHTVTSTRGTNYTVCINAFEPFSSNAGGGEVDFILGDAFLRNVYSVYDYGDFVQGLSGYAQGDPYIKLLPLTDPTAASAEFKTARAATLSATGMPPQLDPKTINGNPQAIPGTGGGSGGGSGGNGGGGGDNGAMGSSIGGWLALGAAVAVGSFTF
ncbi:Acid protease, partial [Rhizoctonia solani]